MNNKDTVRIAAKPFTQPVQRKASIDVYRGFVMLLMLAEVLELMTLVQHYPDSRIAQWLQFHTTHVAWTGCSLHDLIQPSFTFLVGVSLPFSLAARKAKGSSFGLLLWHALWRSSVLIVLGVLLRSLGKPSTNFFFVDTLTQIGLGYFFLFLIAHWSRMLQILALTIILLGYWALFAFWPLPEGGIEATAFGVPVDWPYLLDGFAAHWNKNMNPAFEFDLWFMNLFPREEPFVGNSGGYVVLSAIPTLGTMILGLLAGEVLKSRRTPIRKAAWLLLPGVLMVLIAWGLGVWGVCPIVKRIWTPAWVLYSGGFCYAILGALFLVCDVRKSVWWAFPVLVIGANSIAAYVMSWTMEQPIKAFWLRHLGEDVFQVAGEAWEPILLGSTILATMWLVLLWMYRQRIFVKI